MTWYVKENDESGQPGAISLGRVIAVDADGSHRHEFTTFLPGDRVPDEYVAPIYERMMADQTDHVWRFLETDGDLPPVGQMEQERAVATPAAAPPPPPAPPAPPVPSKFAGMNRQQLEAAWQEKVSAGVTLNVVPTGANGGVVNADIVKALDESEQAQGSNPFA